MARKVGDDEHDSGRVLPGEIVCGLDAYCHVFGWIPATNGFDARQVLFEFRDIGDEIHVLHPLLTIEDVTVGNDGKSHVCPFVSFKNLLYDLLYRFFDISNVRTHGAGSVHDEGDVRVLRSLHPLHGLVDALLFLLLLGCSLWPELMPVFFEVVVVAAVVFIVFIFVDDLQRQSLASSSPFNEGTSGASSQSVHGGSLFGCD
mmetsp:Transcript_6865/g.20135  ORF Transcript_6865/g.20135 Transcript_6865/m.20135 type:complete len:202 (-) Transcript_6865:44-649(-)